MDVLNSNPVDATGFININAICLKKHELAKLEEGNDLAKA